MAPFQLSPFLGPAVLAFMWVWGIIEYYANKHYKAQYKPAVRGPHTRTSHSVSVVVRSLKPRPNFKKCLTRWLENRPLEIIISTTLRYLHDINSIVQEVVKETGDLDGKIKIITTEQGARIQMITAVLQAQGEVIATCDNHILWGKKYLDNMLPCFDDPRVGAAGPQTIPTIPTERQDPEKITKWEVAAARLSERDSGVASHAVMMHVAARWCWILAGGTCLYRARVLQDKDCVDGYLNDSWNGVKLDAGEDTWLSRWVLKHDMIIATQRSEETNTTATPRTSSVFLGQVLRWERSTIQSYLRTLYEVPQMYKHPLIIFKTFERIFKTPILLTHLIAWIYSFKYYPVPTIGLLAYYSHLKYKDLNKFFIVYPYMRKYWWAVLLLDYSDLGFNIVAHLTLSDPSWEHV